MPIIIILMACQIFIEGPPSLSPMWSVMGVQISVQGAVGVSLFRSISLFPPVVPLPVRTTSLPTHLPPYFLGSFLTQACLEALLNAFPTPFPLILGEWGFTAAVFWQYRETEDKLTWKFGKWRTAFVVQIKRGNCSWKRVLSLHEENQLGSLHLPGVCFSYFTYV